MTESSKPDSNGMTMTAPWELLIDRATGSNIPIDDVYLVGDWNMGLLMGIFGDY